MKRPFENDMGYIRCPCKRSINKDSQVVNIVENHIFWFDFLESYEIWTYHEENENDNVTVNVPKQNEGIPDRDEMFDILDDIIGDDAEVDVSTAVASTV